MTDRLKNYPPGMNVDRLLGDYGDLTEAYEAKWGCVPTTVKLTIA